MKYIAIFCGSSLGINPVFAEQAELLGRELVKHGYGIVYGGGNVGLMGAVADSVLDAGGEVIGVIPEFLSLKELEHLAITQVHRVKTMSERKDIMNELCDGVITLPGGFGTLDEYFEMLTLGQLSQHKKGVALLNTEGYYDSLIKMVDNMIDNGFLKDEYRDIFIVDKQVIPLISKIKNYKAPLNEKWAEPKIIKR